MSDGAEKWFDSAPLPDAPGWYSWEIRDPRFFNKVLGPMQARRGGDGMGDDVARVRMFPQPGHANFNETVHGGVIAAFLDCAIFAAAYQFGAIRVSGAVTLELQLHYVGPASMDQPLEMRAQLVRETGSMLFLNGLIVQDEGAARVASFTAILKKTRPRG